MKLVSLISLTLCFLFSQTVMSAQKKKTPLSCEQEVANLKKSKKGEIFFSFTFPTRTEKIRQTFPDIIVRKTGMMPECLDSLYDYRESGDKKLVPLFLKDTKENQKKLKAYFEKSAG